MLVDAAAHDVITLLVAWHLTRRETGICLVATSVDVDNPMGSLTEEELIRPPNGRSSCSVDPRGPHWTQQLRLVQG